MKNIIENVNKQVCYHFEDYEKKKLPEPKKAESKVFSLQNEEDEKQKQQEEANKIKGTRRLKSMITEEYKELTGTKKIEGRNSSLGNNVFHMRPNQILRSLHQKTYFKAC